MLHCSSKDPSLSCCYCMAFFSAKAQKDAPQCIGRTKIVTSLREAETPTTQNRATTKGSYTRYNEHHQTKHGLDANQKQKGTTIRQNLQRKEQVQFCKEWQNDSLNLGPDLCFANGRIDWSCWCTDCNHGSLLFFFFFP
jgi:hypothetical protein